MTRSATEPAAGGPTHGAQMDGHPHGGDPLARTWRRLSRIEQLGPNWDSYGAAPPAPAAVAGARQLITTVHRRFEGAVAGASYPYAVAPLSDGSVQVEWRGPGGNIEVEVNPRGEFAYFLEQPEGDKGVADEADSVRESEILRLIPMVLGATATG